MLEAVGRAFEVDVATSKATCIDLLRANDFDVIVACERLTDGSGLELLSHVGQRWPSVIRILAIEPQRRALLRGRLGPFKLFETLSYPIDETKLEAALTRAAEAIARRQAAEAGDEEDSETADDAAPAVAAGHGSPPPAITVREAVGQAIAPTNRSSFSNTPAAPQATATGQQFAYRPPAAPASLNAGAGRPLTSQSQAGVRQTPTGLAGGQRQAEASRSVPVSQGLPDAPAKRGSYSSPVASERSGAVGSPRASAPGPSRVAPRSDRNGGGGYPPLPAKGSKIVPLGSPAAGDYRILPHDYQEHRVPGASIQRRKVETKPLTLQEKAAALASEAVSAVTRYIKPQESATSPAPPPANPRKKR